jgi:hypothetical protein
MWLRVWRDSYQFFGWDPNLVTSNEWTRQDSICALFMGNDPVGVVFFDEKNLQLPYYNNDSYFRMWPPQLLEKIRSSPDAHQAVIISNFTLAPAYRKKPNSVDFKMVLHSLAALHFINLESSRELLIGTVVKMSGMDKLSYKIFAKCLAENIEEKGVMVDLLYWTRKDMLNAGLPQLLKSKLPPIEDIFENEIETFQYKKAA